jgi:hypothetical protein
MVTRQAHPVRARACAIETADGFGNVIYLVTEPNRSVIWLMNTSGATPRTPITRAVRTEAEYWRRNASPMRSGPYAAANSTVCVA